MYVPTSPAELDPGWLNEVLAGADAFRGAEILAVDRRVIGVGYGLDGTVARIALEVEGGPPEAPTSLVAKLVSGPRGRDEVVFYEHIAPHMPIRVPRYYAGFVSEDAARAVLLLEDLDGTVQGDAVSGADRAQTEAVLAAMARFHAVFQDAEHEVMPRSRSGVPRPPRGSPGFASACPASWSGTRQASTSVRSTSWPASASASRRPARCWRRRRLRSRTRTCTPTTYSSFPRASPSCSIGRTHGVAQRLWTSRASWWRAHTPTSAGLMIASCGRATPVRNA